VAFKPLILFSLQMYDNWLTTVAYSGDRQMGKSNGVDLMNVARDFIKKTFQRNEHILSVWNKPRNKTNN
jgi:hypothetical protein